MSITVLGSWPQRGNVELYFEHRYAAHQRRLGSLTEYVAFADAAPVLRDLRRMPPKTLSALEQAILADTRSAIEMELTAEAEAREREHNARERSAAIAAGMEQARQRGVHVGRPAGGESLAAFFAKDTSQRVLAVLREQPGRSIRQVAQAAGVAVNMLRKVAGAVEHASDKYR